MTNKLPKSINNSEPFVISNRTRSELREITDSDLLYCMYSHWNIAGLVKAGIVRERSVLMSLEDYLNHSIGIAEIVRKTRCYQIKELNHVFASTKKVKIRFRSCTLYHNKTDVNVAVVVYMECKK